MLIPVLPSLTSACGGLGSARRFEGFTIGADETARNRRRCAAAPPCMLCVGAQVVVLNLEMKWRRREKDVFCEPEASSH